MCPVVFRHCRFFASFQILALLGQDTRFFGTGLPTFFFQLLFKLFDVVLQVLNLGLFVLILFDHVCVDERMFLCTGIVKDACQPVVLGLGNRIELMVMAT